MNRGWVGLAALACASPAAADTLGEALAKAYRGNPTIAAGRAQLDAVREGVPIARAAGLPTIGTNAGYSRNVLRGGNSLTNPEQQLNAFAGVTVPIYAGGAVRNSVRAAKIRAEAGAATLRDLEATTLADVVAAYTDVIRTDAIVGLNAQNVRVLETNLAATRDRFQVGDLTRTDIAQSEARLMLARAQLRTAEAGRIAARETYTRLVGEAPGVLAPTPPLPAIPATADAAVAIALGDSPTLLAARQERQAAGYDVRVARAERLPRLGVTLGQNYNNFLGSLGAGQGFSTRQSGTSTVAGVSLQLPLFQGGRVGAGIRQARALSRRADEEAIATERLVIAQTRSAHAQWEAAEDVIRSAEAAVAAQRLALEGVRAENGAGTRTVLDTLNAEQEVLNSEVTLVTAQRDRYVAGFVLLTAMGRADAEDLGLAPAAER
jgi:outer membrane protein